MISFRKRLALPLGTLIFLAPCSIAVKADALPVTTVAQRDNVAKDASLVRFYDFDEGKGDTIHNRAANGIGALNIQANDIYLNESLSEMFNKQDYPTWTKGRTAGKSALSISTAKGNVLGSLFYNVPSDTFTVETWVRMHEDNRPTASATFASVGSGWDNGWKVMTDAYNTSFILGRTPGTAIGQGVVAIRVPGRLSSNVWHQVVAVFDGKAKEVALYIDGKFGGKTKYEGDYNQPISPSSNEQTPELDRGGLMIGSTDSSPGDWRFDIDELAVYDKALTAEAIGTRFNTSKPTASAEQQAAAYKNLLAKQAQLAQVTVKLPPSTGYFDVAKPIPLAIAIPSAAKFNGRYAVDVQLRDMAGKSLWQKKGELTASPTANAELKVSVPAEKCGLYRLTTRLTDSTGKELKTVEYPIGVRLPQLPITQMPATAPLAHFGATSMHSEDLGLGGNFERIIHPWCPPLPQGGYEWKYPDLYVQKALDNKLVVLYTIMSPVGKSFKDMADDPKAWEAWVRELVTHFKGRIAYWEVLNEPNAGGHLTAGEYVGLLKSAFAVIREVDPQAKVVGIGGTANFENWTEDVLAAGGGPYLDILSFHNYIGTSPIQSYTKYKKVDAVRASVQKYIGHPAPLWNGECGIHQPVRVDGRPMTDEELLKAYPGRSSNKDGWATASVDAIMMTTEHRSACWQVQSILMDLAAGAEKYFMLMGSGRYYPYTKSTGQDFPSEKGLGLAAMSSVTTTMQKIRFIPLSVSGVVGLLITDKSGKNTAVFFADKKMTLPLDFPGIPAGSTVQGIDFIGNPLTWKPQQNRLSLNVSDEPIYLFDVPETLAETRLLSVSKFPEKVSPRETVQGELTVVNSSDQPLKGQLQLAVEGGTINPVPAVSLLAGERKTVPFTFTAGNLERGPHTISAQLTQNGAVASRSEHTFISEGVAIPVPMSAKPIVLDGDTSEWAGITAARADQPNQVVIGRPDVGVADARWWQGPKDLSYTVKTAWRPNDGLYLLIDVTDNVLTVAPEGKNQFGYLWDCLELFFDGRAVENQTTTYSVGAEQTVVIPQLTEKATPNATVSFARSTPTLDIEFVGKKTATGYLMEGRVKPKEGSPFKVAEGTHFGMDVTFDDADNGQRRVQMALHGTQKNSFDTSDWGRYVLSSGK